MLVEPASHILRSVTRGWAATPLPRGGRAHAWDPASLMGSSLRERRGNPAAPGMLVRVTLGVPRASALPVRPFPRNRVPLPRSDGRVPDGDIHRACPPPLRLGRALPASRAMTPVSEA
jgi:hypothetical protein